MFHRIGEGVGHRNMQIQVAIAINRNRKCSKRDLSHQHLIAIGRIQLRLIASVVEGVVYVNICEKRRSIVGLLCIDHHIL